MAAVIIFQRTWPAIDDTFIARPVDAGTELHVFERDADAIRYSQANLVRPHTLIRVDGERWHVGKPIEPAPADSRGEM